MLNLEEANYAKSWRKNIPERGDSEYKGPGARKNLSHLKNGNGWYGWGVDSRRMNEMNEIEELVMTSKSDGKSSEGSSKGGT